MDFAKLSEILTKVGEPSFRLKQITKNYYSGRYSSFTEMTDLPKGLRDHLQENLVLSTVTEDKIIEGGGTIKARLKLGDGKMIESVLMDYGDWLTACISSQVGCPLGCTFCATGKMGFVRNLTSDEIIDQVLFWNHKIFPKYIGRVVYMGMGEPFLNWDNVISSLNQLNDKNGLNIGHRKVSISTAGIVPKIIEFANVNNEVNLAVSLHSPDQETRIKIMPIAKTYHFDELQKACLYYVDHTRRQLFFEYVLIAGVNDSRAHLMKLIDFITQSHLFFLNLIPLNNVVGGMPASSPKVIAMFESELTKRHVPYTVRHSLGQSINSACGQLIVEKTV